MNYSNFEVWIFRNVCTHLPNYTMWSQNGTMLICTAVRNPNFTKLEVLGWWIIWVTTTCSLVDGYKCFEDTFVPIWILKAHAIFIRNSRTWVNDVITHRTTIQKYSKKYKQFRKRKGRVNTTHTSTVRSDFSIALWTCSSRFPPSEAHGTQVLILE